MDDVEEKRPREVVEGEIDSGGRAMYRLLTLTCQYSCSDLA